MFSPPSRLKLAALTGASIFALAFVSAVQAQTANTQTPKTQAKPATDETVSEVVITGQRLSTANSLQDQKKATGVVNVISADDLGKLPDANVADALARIPGVNVVVNQETGEGEYVSIRGLASTYNAYSINGVRVALTDSGSRKMSMTVLPPNGLKAISVNKTLTPDLDGDAIGGSVNFVTPTAFDFRKPTLRVFASYGLNDRAQKQDEPAGSGQIQIDGARKFGNGDFGLFGSVYYGKSHYTNEESENDGEWEPYRWRKDSVEPIDSRSMYLPGIDLDFRRGEQERFGGNFSADYQTQQHDFYVRGQYAKLNRTGTNDYTDFRSRPTKRLTQVNLEDTTLLQPEQMITGRDPVKGNIYGYTVGQIVDTDKDGAITDADRKSSNSYWSLFGRSGVWAPTAFQFARTHESQDQESSLYTVNAGGQSRFERLTLDYDLSYSYGEKGTPLYYGIGYNCDKCSTDPMFTSTGILWSSADPRFPQAQLPAYAANVDHRDDLLPFDGASMSKDKQSDARTALKVDARYAVSGLIDYVKGGFKYLKSEREYDSTPIWEGDLSGTPLNGKSLAASGLVERQVDGFFKDRYYYGSVLSRDRVIAAVNAARAANPATFSTADLSRDDKKGSETIYAGYALAHLRSGGLEVVAGARVEHTKVETTAWISDASTSGFGKTNRDYTNVLPSITAVYRQGETLVYRSAIWTSFSRPEYSNISRGESVTRDPATKEIIAISRGNPDLKPGESVNFDLSAEWYPDRSSVVSIGVFHKKIKNFIFTNGRSVSAPTKEGMITITQPQNGEDATLTGVELNLIKSFEGLSAPFDGFGVEANVTSQTSEAETGLAYRRGHPITFLQAPDLIYNTSLTYQKYGVEAKLSYQYQGAYIEDTRDNAVDKWVQPNKSLDLHTRYNIRQGLTVDFDVQNILDGHRYYTTKGKNPTYQKDYMEPGRNFILRVAYSY